jgi:hypothetical protein
VTFVAVVTGWILSHRHRYVTEVIFSSGKVGNGHWCRFHRFFSHAAWDLDTLSLHLAKLIVTILAPGATLSWAVDDTLCRKRGLTLYGAGMHYDPLISSRSKRLVSWGHDWVVVCLIVAKPFWAPTKVFALGERLPLVGGAAIPDSGLLDLDQAEACLDGPLRQMAVVDHMLPPRVILEVGVTGDPGGDLGLNGLGEQPVGAVAKDLGENVLAGGQRHDVEVGGRLVHGGVLLGLVGQMVCLKPLHHQGYPDALQTPVHDFWLYPPLYRFDPIFFHQRRIASAANRAVS